MVTHDPHAAAQARRTIHLDKGLFHEGVMKFLPLVWKNLWRRKIRTLFTLGAVFVASSSSACS